MCLEQHETGQSVLQISVPVSLTQRVRKALEELEWFDKSSAICITENGSGEKIALISIKRPCESTTAVLKGKICECARLNDGAAQRVILSQVQADSSPLKTRTEQKSSILAVFQEWLYRNNIPFSSLSKETVGRLDRLSSSYMTYPPMALFGVNAFTEDLWTTLSTSVGSSIDEAARTDLFGCLARRLEVTHIAQNSPIAASGIDEKDGENVLRRPSLVSLYGNFGEKVTTPPAKSDFDNALWVHDKHDQIHEVWAPLYTMHSRGNLREKQRLLDLLKRQQNQGILDPQKSTAVDLFAGIGYFAFCYARAGMRRVLCWDLNPWSVEGMRRGAGMNKFPITVVQDDESVPLDSQIFMFQEDNAHALERVEEARNALPPFRHVNCGMLPTSESSWPLAVRLLDPEPGGWIHAHLNLALAQLDEKRQWITEEFERLVRDVRPTHTVACEHVEQVKTFAPGVVHCVFDLHIWPATDRSKIVSRRV